MAKRSPISGYNHNVRYRGLIFHVQTEDSGILSPHLFTHMFHGGVIISTRKLVYDSGSAEESIKSLMQAQHKAVLKDLKRGHFDDKIDEYLGQTEGLLPRGTPAAEETDERISEPVIPVAAAMVEAAPIEIEVAVTAPTVMPIALVQAPEPAPPAVARTATPPPIPTRQAGVPPPVPARVATPPNVPTATPRTITAERKSAPSQVRTSLPPPPPSADLDPPTVNDPFSSVRAASTAAPNTIRDSLPLEFAIDTTPRSEPDIEIFRLDLDEPEPADAVRRRTSHDTDVQMPSAISDGVPASQNGSGSGSARQRMPGESVPPLPPAPEKRTGERSAVGAASLPPVRPLTGRPGLASSPTVMPRPASAGSDERTRGRESDPVEVYAPAPAADPSPGTYAQHSRRKPLTVPQEIPRERSTGSMAAIPAGLGRPRSAGTSSSGPIPRQISREASPPVGAKPEAMQSAPTPAPIRSPIPSPAARSPTGPRPRTPTPSRGGPPRAPSASSGVVMTRPAVIVGAPPKPTAQRVRKAREEEGRGFGQGLISEKSLDEVILAYLSEDADDK